ncbi:hypothetical protein HUO13_17500 [Saccharopolyspora erythraea]|uniref:DUF6461 domain-containing protein n=1 Tax=Saccharopolyspora erythraea TaxID=1836 RepID=UPI001BAD1E25|nr:DUF6461 domain-containing protein [Saccharopolyspora erythraea]QUH02357.1 hypothetical protein HUO13_17500 [Saccharopolyspora erythraea]
MNDIGDLAWADAHAGADDHLDEIYCLTFIKGVGTEEALRRFGAFADTIAVRTPEEIGSLNNFEDGYPTMASALGLGEWTVVFEPSGYEGALLVAALSRGTEAFSLLRHDYAESEGGYAVDGVLITGFDPLFPNHRYGAEPDRLLPQMREVGFALGEDDDQFDNAYSRSLRLAERFTSALPTRQQLTAPLVSAHVEPWFSDAVRPEVTGQQVADAVAEVRRLAAKHGLTGTPGLADALAAASESTAPVPVSPESELGRHVRAWLAEAHRASWSLNDHRARMSEAERYRGYDLGWLTKALGTALRTGPRG